MHVHSELWRMFPSTPDTWMKTYAHAVNGLDQGSCRSNLGAGETAAVLTLVGVGAPQAVLTCVFATDSLASMRAVFDCVLPIQLSVA